MSKILSTSVVGFAGMYQWKVEDLGAHTSFLLVQRNIFQLLCQFSCNLLDRGNPQGFQQGLTELLERSTIWNFHLLLGYVKQTASPYSSMISCIMDLLDTLSDKSYPDEVRLWDRNITCTIIIVIILRIVALKHAN